jgi:hypothetical protein
VTKVRQIEEANKFELASSIKALVARALADEMIEGGMSASLIGRLGSSTFRPSAAAVSMSLTGSCFSSESAPGPLYGVLLVKKFMQSGTSFFIRQFLCSI